MAFYTDEPIQGASLSLLDAPTTLGESMAASFEQSWATSISPLIHSAGELNEQTMGEFRYDPTRRDIVQTRGPATPMLSKEVADQRVKESGLEVDVPADGMREGALTLLLERRRAERERQLILENAPSGSMPANILAAFAAQAVDPLNIASAFIPVVGEARITAALSKAATVSSRLGVRAGAGAVEGAVGAAVLEPAVYTLSQKLQDEYDLTDSLTNIAFGAVLGGSLRGVGGIVRDRYFPSAKIDIGDSLDDMPQAAKAELSRAGYVDESFTRLNRGLEAGLAEQRASSVQAVTNLMPEFRAELEAAAAGRISNVADMRAELDSVNRQIEAIPESYRDVARQFQSQGMTRKEAERAARDSIAQDLEAARARREEVTSAIEGNRQAELARSDLARLERGEIPERFKERVADESSRLASGITRSRLAEAVAPIPFAEKAELFKQTFASTMNGYDISPRTFLDLKSPDLVVRQRAIEQIKNAPRRTPKEYAAASQRAADDIAATPKDQAAFDREQLDFDEQTAKEVADQTGYNLADDPELKEAQAFEGQAEAFGAVYRANALCMLR